MCSGGGSIVKVWEESLGEANGEDEQVAVNGKRMQEHCSEEDDSEADGDESEEEEKPRKRKKRKRNKGKDKSGGQHVMAFKGMD